MPTWMTYRLAAFERRLLQRHSHFEDYEDGDLQVGAFRSHPGIDPGDLEVSGDSLRGSDVTGPSRLVMRSKEVHLEDVSGDLELESTNRDIEVHAAKKLPVGKMTITGRRVTSR